MEKRTDTKKIQIAKSIFKNFINTKNATGLEALDKRKIIDSTQITAWFEIFSEIDFSETSLDTSALLREYVGINSGWYTGELNGILNTDKQEYKDSALAISYCDNAEKRASFLMTLQRMERQIQKELIQFNLIEMESLIARAVAVYIRRDNLENSIKENIDFYHGYMKSISRLVPAEVRDSCSQRFDSVNFNKVFAMAEIVQDGVGSVVDFDTIMFMCSKLTEQTDYVYNRFVILYGLLWSQVSVTEAFTCTTEQVDENLILHLENHNEPIDRLIMKSVNKSYDFTYRGAVPLVQKSTYATNNVLNINPEQAYVTCIKSLARMVNKNINSISDSSPSHYDWMLNHRSFGATKISRMGLYWRWLVDDIHYNAECVDVNEILTKIENHEATPFSRATAFVAKRKFKLWKQAFYPELCKCVE